MVGFLKNKILETKLLGELDRRGVANLKDKIPYGGMHNIRSRLVVFGFDSQKIMNLL
ncbi:hypothetical protein BH09BAC4_BH09BAC4_05200 [soil metagenome]